jgi:hypothetical protein
MYAVSDDVNIRFVLEALTRLEALQVKLAETPEHAVSDKAALLSAIEKLRQEIKNCVPDIRAEHEKAA